MHLSTILHVTELEDGWRGVYSPYGHGIAFLFDQVWDDLQQGDLHKINPEILEYLIDKNIVVSPDFEAGWLKDNRGDARVKLNSMYLVVTQNCNFGCKYCAVVENFDSPARLTEKMNREVGRQSVDFFENHLKRLQPEDARVTFYGGEPMLNQDLLFDIVPRIKDIHYPKQKKPVEIVMITNGYLYNPKLTHLFKEHGVGVCVSLDGTRRHQDITRLTRTSQKTTFERVIGNFHRYHDAGISMGISTALGRHNAFDLQEICEFYCELGAPFVEFQIPYQVANESNALWVSAADIARNLMDAYSYLRSRGITEGTTFRRIRDFSSGLIHRRDCGASASQLVVAPDGSIGPCHSLVGTRTFFSGNVNDPACDPTRMDNFLEWAGRYPLNMPICEECCYITLCGGGCIYNSYVSNGTIWGKDPQVCAYMKEMTDWILRNLWDEFKMKVNTKL